MFAFRSPATVYINICGSIASYIFIHSEFETAEKKTLAFAMRLIMQTD